MDENNRKILFSIIKSALSNEQGCDIDYNSVSDEILLDLIPITNMHDITHLLAFGLLKNNLIDDEIKPQFQQVIQMTVKRYERVDTELKRIIDQFEENKIPFIPLKGSVIRKFYPEPWMRTSCDIDVLVKEDDLKRARVCLEEQCGYSYDKKTSHDISLFSQSGVHIELHYTLIEDKLVNQAEKILEKIWELVNVKDGYKYLYKMPEELFYFYHISHMAKHFQNGGCGIRPFIDLWILDKKLEKDSIRTNKLLKESNLMKFVHKIKKLNKVWFECDEYDEITGLMEEYILTGGVFGTTENRILFQQQKIGGKFKYAISKVFIPYNVIKYHYPILEKHKWLTPIMEVRRWFKLVFCGGLKRSVNELNINTNASKYEVENVRILLKELGI